MITSASRIKADDLFKRAQSSTLHAAPKNSTACLRQGRGRASASWMPSDASLLVPANCRNFVSGDYALEVLDAPLRDVVLLVVFFTGLVGGFLRASVLTVVNGPSADALPIDETGEQCPEFLDRIGDALRQHVHVGHRVAVGIQTEVHATVVGREPDAHGLVSSRGERLGKRRASVRRMRTAELRGRGHS